jgi:hypothetical protein
LQFGEDVRDVVAYGLEAEEESLSDLFVAISLGD